MEDVKISPTAQYIIDEVRKLRLELDLTQRDLSKVISPESELSIVGNIESTSRSNKYTDHQLNIIANKFGRSIHNFYPKAILSDIPQKKTRIPIPKGLGPTGIVNAMIEAEKNYLNDTMTTKEITALSNQKNNESRPETDFTAILARKVEAGLLKRFEVEVEENGRKKIVVKFQKV